MEDGGKNNQSSRNIETRAFPTGLEDKGRGKSETRRKHESRYILVHPSYASATFPGDLRRRSQHEEG
jgi:hypothetical protein